MTVNKGISDYLSCEVILDYENKRGWIGQPHMIAKIEDEFGEEVKKMKKTKSAGTPGKRIKGKFEDKEKLMGEMQTRYRLGVGMLLFMVKHS